MRLPSFAVIIVVGSLLQLTHLASAHVAAQPAPATGRTLKSDYVRQLVFLASAPNAMDTAADVADDADAPDAENFLDWYRDGVESYLANDWAGCADSIQRAINGYRDYYAATASCRLQCRHVADTVRPFLGAAVDDLPYYESIVRRALCLIKCKQLLLPHLDAAFAMGAWEQEVFRSRKPYAYMQLCHYRLGNILASAQATFTTLVRNPTDHMMKNNLKFYVDMLGNAEQRIEDLEQWRYATPYLEALAAYEAGDFPAVVRRMEESLALFRTEYDECRAYCEGDYEQSWQPDFVTYTANHFTYVLNCKQNCTQDLGNIRGREFEHVFASHYEYLHISYYRVNQTLKACQAAASFVHLRPEASDMQENLDIYQSGQSVACKARPESKLYGAQQSYENRLLDFIAREFVDERLKIPARKLQALHSDTDAIAKILRQS